MTPAEFHSFLTHPRTGDLLDELLMDNARVDAALERDRRDRNEEIYLEAVRAWFRKTDAR